MELKGPEIPVKEISKEELEARWGDMFKRIGKAFNNVFSIIKEHTIVIDKDLPYSVIQKKVKKILVEKGIKHNIIIINKVSRKIKSSGCYFIPKNKIIKE